MTIVRAVIFDLGGTLLDWPDWNKDVGRRWALSYDYLTTKRHEQGGGKPGPYPSRDEYVQAMLQAEQAHWQRVVAEQWSGPPSTLIREGFRRLGLHVHESELLTALDGYAHAVDGWAVVYPDTRETLRQLRELGYRLGLLSNTWWAAEWHNADLAAHGLDGLLDELVYTSDLPHSKPHPSVFIEITERLGIEPEASVMVGDRMVDDISGALSVGMRAVWKKNDSWPKPEHIYPTATIEHLAELPIMLRTWVGNE